MLWRVLMLGLGLSIAALSGYVLSEGVPAWNLDGPTQPSISRWATVSTDTLNVREGPTTDSAVLDSLVDGDSIEVVGPPESGFVPVSYGDRRAWLAVEYLSFTGQTGARTVNPLPVQEVVATEAPDVRAEPEPKPEREPGPKPEAPPLAAEVAEPVERWIEIDRSTATVTLHEGGATIAAYSGRIGRDPSPDGFYSTAVGTFRVYSLNKGLAPTPFADDTWLTDWVGFDPNRKNGIHSPVRDADGVEKSWQNPTTLGCVRLSADAAVAVFDFAEIGMRVEVHD